MLTLTLTSIFWHFTIIITRDNVVSQRLGFGRWNFFIGVANWHVFFNFPVSRAFGTRLKGHPEKLCDFIGCNTWNHVQVRLGWTQTGKAKYTVMSVFTLTSFWPCLLLVCILLQSKAEHLRFSFTYRTNSCTRQLSNSVQNRPYMHPHIPRKRFQGSSCFL